MKAPIRSLCLASLIALTSLSSTCIAQDSGQVSRVGDYRGYSEPFYEEWKRESQYVTMRDGVKLAVDVIRPAEDGVVVEDPLPLIWTHHRYHRSNPGFGRVRSIVDAQPYLRTLLKNGYIIAAVDVRGAGASFGQRRGEACPEEVRDAYDLMEWFADQSWCDGNIGMYGRSYLGITQYLAAASGSPHLRAIFPEMSGFTIYDTI